MGKALNSLVSADQLVGGVSARRTRHAGQIRNVDGENPLDHGPQRVSFRAPISHDSTRRCVVEDHTAFVAILASDQIDGMRQMLLNNVGEVCDAVGQTVDANGGSLTPDLFLDLFEKVEMRFDNDGNPILPTLVAAPSILEKLMEQPFTEEHTRRQEEIIAKKRTQWQATRRTRRLA